MTDTPEPVTVPSSADPLAVLRTMAKFMPGTDRGLCDIMDGDSVIGHAALIGHPERQPMPLYCAASRIVECVELAAWLKARGFEASACKWEQPNGGRWTVAALDRRWRLLTGPAVVPALPPTAPDAAGVAARSPAHQQAAAQHQAMLARQLYGYDRLGALGDLLGAPAGLGASVGIIEHGQISNVFFGPEEPSLTKKGR